MNAPAPTSIDHLRLPRRLARTIPPVLAGAVLGGLGARAGSSWYANLRNPSWQPPAAVFAPVWTAVYASAAGATTSVLERVSVEERQGLEQALWINMGLNAGWCWLFFAARQPRWALAELLVLQASTLDLVRRARAAGDGRAVATLAPYVGWNAFATALNVAVVRRTP